MRVITPRTADSPAIGTGSLTCEYLYIFMDSKNILSSTSSSQRTANHKCTGAPDTFCVVCGDHKVAKKLQKLTHGIRSSYKACFDMTVPHEKAWAPQNICNACASMLRRWKAPGNKLVYFSHNMERTKQ